MVAPESVDFSSLNFREVLKLQYVLVDDLILLQGNPKLHNLDKLGSSIVENGFLDPPKWDATLNRGAGGIVEGNGRVEALKAMQDAKKTAPRGIATSSNGKWAIPVIFGCDARSETAAKRYAIDHNNLVMAGGNLSAQDMSRTYDPEAYLVMLQELNKQQNLPLTMHQTDLDALLKQLEGCNERAGGNSNYEGGGYGESGYGGANGSGNNGGSYGSGGNYDNENNQNGGIPEDNKNIDEEELAKTNCECPNCGFQWWKS